MGIFENIFNHFSDEIITTTTVLAVLLMVLILAIFEFLVYRFISHRSFYNKSFNIAVAVLPFFIATILLCLQSNVVITLGTIGALAIIRFRTAVKDPVDMLYLLWSVYIGIACGCQLFEVGFLTSIAVALVLLALEHINFGRKSFVLILHSNEDIEEKLKQLFKDQKISNQFKSKNYTSKGYDYAVEFTTKTPVKLETEFTKIKQVEKYSIITYDADDII